MQAIPDVENLPWEGVMRCRLCTQLTILLTMAIPVLEAKVVQQPW